MTTPADIIEEAVWDDAAVLVKGQRIIAALDAAGFDIVARQPDTCPTCGSDDPSVCAKDDEPHGQWDNGSDGCCPNAWHDTPKEAKS